MSIFKDTFPSFVNTQINQRQFNTLPTRHPQDLSYLNSRKAWVRLTSGVNILTGITDIEGKDTYDNSLAKQYVLQGGTLYDNTLNGVYTGSLREGIGSNSNMVYSTTTPSGKLHRLGIRPMPGITDVDIKSKSAYGSLREATINFVCWDIKQLEDLELLYMRPGFTSLLEWGWSPYISNDDKYISRIDYDDNIISETPSGSLQEIYKTLYNKSIEQSANYDTLIGFIKNFQWSFRDDGGYNCTTTIISFGEVLESLKINYTTPNEKFTGGLLGVQTEFQTGSISDIYDKSKFAGILYEVASHISLKLPETELKDKLKINGEVYNDELIDGGKYDVAAYQIDIESQDKNDSLPKSNMYQYYITLESLCKLMNKYILLTSEKGSITSLSTLERSYWNGSVLPLYCLIHPLQLSVDPSVCLIKSPIWENGFSFSKVNENVDETTPGAVSPLLGNNNYANEAKNIVQSIIDFGLDKIGSKTEIENNIIIYFSNKSDKHKALEELIKQYEIKRGKKLNLKNQIKTPLPQIGSLETSELKSTKGTPQLTSDNLAKLFGIQGYLPFGKYTTESGIVVQSNIIFQNLSEKDKNQFNNTLNSKGSLTNVEQTTEKLALYNKNSEDASKSSKTNLEFLKKLKPFFKDDKIDSGLGVISNIYVNINYLYTLILNQDLYSLDTKEKNDINLYDYLKTTLSSIQSSIGNVNNFDIHVDPIDSIGRIIDINATTENPEDDFNKATVIEIQKADNISSFVRKISLQSQIFPEQSTIVAISAQTGGGQMGLDNNTLVGFNKGIQDRVLKNKFTPSSNTINQDVNIQLSNIGNSIGRLARYVIDLNYLYNNSFFTDNIHAKYNISNSDEYKNALKDIINALKAISNDPNQFRSIIPTKLSLTMDGIGGMIIGNIFRIPEENLPAGYKGENGIGRKLGYIVTGLGHKLNVKDWETTIDAQTIILESPDNKKSFDYNTIIITDPITGENRLIIPTSSSTNKFNNDKVKTSINFFMNKGFTDFQSAAIVGALLQESGLQTLHANGPFGIA